MTVVRWIGRRLISMAFAIGGSVMAAGAMAGFAVGAFCGRGVPQEGAALGAWLPTADEICAAMLGFGIACALTMIAVIVVWALSKGWPGPPTSLGSTFDGGHHYRDGFVLALGLALAVPPLAAVVGAHPALAFVDQHRELLTNSLDGILLMAPLFELTITATWLAAGIGLLLLFMTRDRSFPRAYVIMLTAQLGLLISTNQAVAITRSAIEPLAGEIPIAQEQIAVVEIAARNLAWAFAASAILLPGVVFSRAVRIRFANESFRSRLANEWGEPVSPSSLRAPQVSLSSTLPRSQSLAPASDSLRSSRYLIQATYLGGPFGGLLQLHDLDQNKGLVAWIAPFRLKRSIQVYADRRRTTEILRIEARQVLGLGGWYDVIDSFTEERVAVVRKRFAADWQIHDGLGHPIGIMTRGDRSLGHATYHACIGPHEAGMLKWSNLLKPMLEINCSADVDREFDRRLGVALGILVFMELSLSPIGV